MVANWTICAELLLLLLSSSSQGIFIKDPHRFYFAYNLADYFRIFSMNLRHRKFRFEYNCDFVYWSLSLMIEITGTHWRGSWKKQSIYFTLPSWATYGVFSRDFFFVYQINPKISFRCANKHSMVLLVNINGESLKVNIGSKTEILDPNLTEMVMRRVFFLNFILTIFCDHLQI